MAMKAIEVSHLNFLRRHLGVMPFKEVFALAIEARTFAKDCGPFDLASKMFYKRDHQFTEYSKMLLAELTSVELPREQFLHTSPSIRINEYKDKFGKMSSDQALELAIMCENIVNTRRNDDPNLEQYKLLQKIFEDYAEVL